MIQRAKLIFLFWTLLSTSAAAQNSHVPEVQQGAVMVRMRAGYSIDEIKKILPARSIHALLLPSQSLTYNPKAAPRMMQASVEQITSLRLAEEPVLRTFRVEYTGHESPYHVCKRLAAMSSVELAEPKYIEKVFYAPNDPDLGRQTYLKVINAFDAWSIYSGDSNIVVGICDNGVDKNHEDIAGNIARNWGEIPGNGKDDDGNGYTDDYDGVNLASFVDDGTKPGETYIKDSHGTSVAGLAGATMNNSIGIAGVGGKCRIFPIKAGRFGNSGVYYGYEGIVYAAIRGFAVVNCSWGSVNTYSALNESLVNFAIARGTVVVAAAGNEQITAPMYPAGYFGVLGVGASEFTDRIANYSAIGAHVKVIAPGVSVYTTDNDNRYANFDGTSAASPIAAGFVALIRGKHPNLDPLQTVEFARLCGDDIRDQNSYYASMLPLRINVLKAMQRDPFSMPAISFVDSKFTVRDTMKTRFSFGDTVTMILRVKNYLGKAANIRFEFSQPDVFQPLILLDSVVKLHTLDGSATAEVGEFRFVVNDRISTPVMMRMDVESDENYQDFFLFPITPASDVTIFQNEGIAITAADNGSIGYAGDKSSLRGRGLLIKPYSNILPATAYSGFATALIATADNHKVMAALPVWSDFGARKKLIEPEENVSILADTCGDFPVQRIGIELRAKYLVNSGTLPAIKIQLTAKNETDKDISQISLGYYFDWDIGSLGENNRVQLYPEGNSGSPGATVAGIAWRDGNYPFVGVASQSFASGAIPQFAGIDASEFYGNTQEIKDQLFKMVDSETSMQFLNAGDIAMSAGMKFPGLLAPGESKECSICIAASLDKNVMREALQQCLQGNVVSSGDKYALVENNDASYFTVSPQPVVTTAYYHGKLLATTSQNCEMYVLDNLGRIVDKFSITTDINGYFSGNIYVSDFHSGIYRLLIISGQTAISKPIYIVR